MLYLNVASLPQRTIGIPNELRGFLPRPCTRLCICIHISIYSVERCKRATIEKSSATWRVNRAGIAKMQYGFIYLCVCWSIDYAFLGRWIVISTNLCVRDKCGFYDQWINGRFDCVTGTWTLRHRGPSNCKRIYQQVRRSSLSQHGPLFRIIPARAG